MKRPWHKRCKACGSPLLQPADDFKREQTVEALRDLRWNVEAAAKKLGIGRSTLYKRLLLYRISDK